MRWSWFAVTVFASLTLAACGGADPVPDREAPAGAGGEVEAGSREPAPEVADGSLAACADPIGGAFYLYLGDDAMVLTRPDGTRARLPIDALEETARAAARDDIRARDPAAVVHLVTDDDRRAEARELVLGVLREEGLRGADHCRPTARSPFPSAADAVFSG